MEMHAVGKSDTALCDNQEYDYFFHNVIQYLKLINFRVWEGGK
jgi:hypothetical protein